MFESKVNLPTPQSQSPTANLYCEHHVHLLPSVSGFPVHPPSAFAAPRKCSCQDHRGTHFVKSKNSSSFSIGPARHWVLSATPFFYCLFLHSSVHWCVVCFAGFPCTSLLSLLLLRLLCCSFLLPLTPRCQSWALSLFSWSSLWFCLCPWIQLHT